jgi:propanol-preferring alcohol dehydrogenase
VRAAIFTAAQTSPGAFLQVEDIPHVLLRVVACGVCRTDLHIVAEICRRFNHGSFPATKS